MDSAQQSRSAAALRRSEHTLQAICRKAWEEWSLWNLRRCRLSDRVKECGRGSQPAAVVHQVEARRHVRQHLRKEGGHGRRLEVNIVQTRPRVVDLEGEHERRVCDVEGVLVWDPEVGCRGCRLLRPDVPGQFVS